MITLQKLRVSDAYDVSNAEIAIVEMDCAFNRVIHDFAVQTELRGIFVVNKENQFSGVITRGDLLDWTRVKIGGVFIKPLPGVEETIRLAGLINAITVADVMRPETRDAHVNLEDTLVSALQIMITNDLIILPVLNPKKEIIGDLTLSEILNRALEVQAS